MRVKPVMYGDTRVRKKFLLFPTTLDNDTRWMEYASILEVYGIVRTLSGMHLGWHEQNFID